MFVIVKVLSNIDYNCNTTFYHLLEKERAQQVLAQTKLSKPIPSIWSQERNEGGCDSISNIKLLISFSIIFKMVLEEICESIMIEAYLRHRT